MNAKFKWFGLSVARKHVYFYSLLILGSIFANTVKEQFSVGTSETQTRCSELRRLAEQVAVFDHSSGH